MEPQENNAPVYGYYVNSIFQLFAIMAFQQYGLVWPLYISMFIISLLIVAQTLIIAIRLSGWTSEKNFLENIKPEFIRHFALPIIYALSLYNIHLIGFTGFAIFASAYITIIACSNAINALVFLAKQEETK
jgi:hypothetical protein